MSTTTDSTATRKALVRGAAYGAGAGVVASIAMGIYAMVASYLKDTGFFTPLHHIATLFAEPTGMMESMMAAMEKDDAFVITGGVAVLGLVIHMMTGAVFGAIVGLAVAKLRLGVAILAAVGLVYGALVFVFSALVGLPLAASIFGVGDLGEGPMAGMNPIADMAAMAGWGVFFSEHLLFGLVTGLLIAAGLRERA
ncbi:MULTISPECIES: hypothetical protein [Nocardioides]|uniref:DUF1440 domain-containing protein n=1 Tax=Nocardioides vastitatis TaxID=2568655 RepID=A0ABW0ZM34_9ACTN|nr:hypothetical protein [Nocardioides sp.]THJ01619.1 hypothetical protein E7Z54_11020 [Nocardioides sp.]